MLDWRFAAELAGAPLALGSFGRRLGVLAWAHDVFTHSMIVTKRIWSNELNDGTLIASSCLASAPRAGVGSSSATVGSGLATAGAVAAETVGSRLCGSGSFSTVTLLEEQCRLQHYSVSGQPDTGHKATLCPVSWRCSSGHERMVAQTSQNSTSRNVRRFHEHTESRGTTPDASLVGPNGRTR